MTDTDTPAPILAAAQWQPIATGKHRTLGAPCQTEREAGHDKCGPEGVFFEPAYRKEPTP
jgi:hypothetical protein